MRVLFHCLFSIAITFVAISTATQEIRQTEKNETSLNQEIEYENQKTSSVKKDDGIPVISKIKRDADDPPFYLIRNPEHIGDGARLRLDFTHPGGQNGSCANFRESAEVVAGRWRIPHAEIPAEMPAEIPAAILLSPEPTPKNIGNDFENRAFDTTTRENYRETTTTTTTIAGTKIVNKKGGFFKGVEEFFRHSLHMDKTTRPVHRSTPAKIVKISPESVTQKAFIQRHNLQETLQGDEDLRKNRVSNYIKDYKKPPNGRDATFNLKIKAIAIPRFSSVGKNGN